MQHTGLKQLTCFRVYESFSDFTGQPGVPVYLAPGQLAPQGATQPRLACPPTPPPSRGQAVSGYLAPHPGYLHPRGASCPGISCPPPWLSSPPGSKLSRLVYLAPRPAQVKIYTFYFVIFLYHFNEFRFSISHKVRNWCLWG